MLDAIVDALAERYPIDRERIFVVGRSRAGASTLEALAQQPRRYRSVATIGAALEPAAAARLASAPLLLAAGERDFAREGVEAFHKALLAAGAKASSVHIHLEAGRWFAVADALSDVLAWFDDRNFWSYLGCLRNSQRMPPAQIRTPGQDDPALAVVGPPTRRDRLVHVDRRTRAASAFTSAALAAAGAWACHNHA